MSKAVKIEKPESIKIPPLISGQNDISRILLELEAVQADFESQKVKQQITELITPPISRRLNEVLDLNRLKITSPGHVSYLIANLRMIKQKAPVVHVTFAKEPEAVVLAKLVEWVRDNLHPQALVNFGVQPGIIGGCVFRTPDHIYDLSFGGKLRSSKSLLVQKMGAIK